MKPIAALLFFAGTASAIIPTPPSLEARKIIPTPPTPITRTIPTPPSDLIARRAITTTTISAVPAPLLDGVCTEMYMHLEIAGNWFLAPWLGCDRVRPQCCAPGYDPTALDRLEDFRVPSCPAGFVALPPATTTILPAGVSSVCCPPSMTALSTIGGDWWGYGVLCARSLTGSESDTNVAATRTAVLPVSFITDTSSSIGTQPSRFRNRVVAVGYFLDPDAVAVETEAARTATISISNNTMSEDKSGDTGNDGLATGAVAGIAIGTALIGALIGAAVAYMIAAKRTTTALHEGGAVELSGEGRIFPPPVEMAGEEFYIDGYAAHKTACELPQETESF
ncbi:hypothetical protein EDC01DRAFT_632034 [Geopyxis carbonaria]|nr:hypothetical protein EDC01DRAFT_632034 [Geopyxis carbonaria]